MIKTIMENNKKREVSAENSQYTYQEAISSSGSDEYDEFLYMVKGGDFSFFYSNGTFEEKVGEFTIEKDSIFNAAFDNLIGEDEELKIENDYNERYLLFKRDDEGNVVIEVHLLPEECDGVIELKNIMFDMRSQADIDGKDTKKRLNKFFEDILHVAEKIPDEPEVSDRSYKLTAFSDNEIK